MTVLAALHAFDLAAFRALYAVGSSGVTTTMILFTMLGSGWSMLVLLPFLAARSTRATAGALTLTLVTTAVVVLILKHVVRRTRPCNALTDVHVLWSVAPKDFSFPSGHTTGAFTFAAFVIVFGWKRWSLSTRLWTTVGALLFAFGVGVSRVYLGFHFPSDVIGAAIVGAIIGVWGARFFTRAEVAARLPQLLLPP